MSVALHLAWISLKGLGIYVSVLAAGAASTWVLFGAPPGERFAPWDGIPGMIGGAVLMFALVFGGLYIVLGGRV